jgi:hypothetical protein
VSLEIPSNDNSAAANAVALGAGQMAFCSRRKAKLFRIGEYDGSGQLETSAIVVIRRSRCFSVAQAVIHYQSATVAASI